MSKRNILTSLAKHENLLKPEHYKKLANTHNHNDFLYHKATFSDDPEILHNLATSRNAIVAERALGNRKLEDRSLRAAMSITDFGDRHAHTISMHPNASASTLEALYNKHEGEHEALKKLGYNRNTPKHILSKLIDAGENLQSVASNPNLDHDSQKRLLDKSYIVKGHLAANSSIHPDISRHLMNDPDFKDQEKEFLASNHSAPHDVLHTLASHPDEDVRLKVARNSAAPKHIRDMAYNSLSQKNKKDLDLDRQLLGH